MPDAVERAFAAQAGPFEDPRFNRPYADDVEWLFERPELGGDELVLDVAAGTGRAARLHLVADPDLGAEQNRVKRLRDPSHTRMLTLVELRALLDGGAAAVGDVERPLLPWLRQTDAPEAEIAGLLRAELDGGPPTGLRPCLRDGELWFVQRFASVTRRRGAGPTGR